MIMVSKRNSSLNFKRKCAACNRYIKKLPFQSYDYLKKQLSKIEKINAVTKVLD